MKASTNIDISTDDLKNLTFFDNFMTDSFINSKQPSSKIIFNQVNEDGTNESYVNFKITKSSIYLQIINPKTQNLNHSTELFLVRLKDVLRNIPPNLDLTHTSAHM
jgi:hypothetical protein